MNVSYVRPVVAFAALAAVAYAAGRWWAIALIVAYIAFAWTVIYAIREHGPADPPTPLRQRQLERLVDEQEVER